MCTNTVGLSHLTVDNLHTAADEVLCQPDVSFEGGV